MTDLLAEARQGYAAAGKCPHLWSSAAWLAWHAGREAGAMGLAEIIKCRASRGYSIKMTTQGGFQWLATFSGDKLDRCTVQSND